MNHPARIYVTHYICRRSVKTVRGKLEVGENDGTMNVLGGFLCLARKRIFFHKSPNTVLVFQVSHPRVLSDEAFNYFKKKRSDL